MANIKTTNVCHAFFMFGLDKFVHHRRIVSEMCVIVVVFNAKIVSLVSRMLNNCQL